MLARREVLEFILAVFFRGCSWPRGAPANVRPFPGSQRLPSGGRRVSAPSVAAAPAGCVWDRPAAVVAETAAAAAAATTTLVVDAVFGEKRQQKRGRLPLWKWRLLGGRRGSRRGSVVGCYRRCSCCRRCPRSSIMPMTAVVVLRRGSLSLVMGGGVAGVGESVP